MPQERFQGTSYPGYSEPLLYLPFLTSFADSSCSGSITFCVCLTICCLPVSCWPGSSIRASQDIRSAICDMPTWMHYKTSSRLARSRIKRAWRIGPLQLDPVLISHNFSSIGGRIASQIGFHTQSHHKKSILLWRTRTTHHGPKARRISKTCSKGSQASARRPREAQSHRCPSRTIASNQMGELHGTSLMLFLLAPTSYF